MEDFQLKVTIPSDEDGCVLFRCPHCGELFKVSVESCEDDSVLDIHCPLCGVTADNFLTQDVIDLALAKTANVFMPELEKLLKKELGGTGNNLVSFDVKMEHDEEPEIPIHQVIEALQKVTCKDCGRISKVSPALAMSSYTCPYCGIGQFNGFREDRVAKAAL